MGLAASQALALPPWLSELLPILALLVVIVIVVSSLPHVDVGHSRAFRTRRVGNWLPVGLTYAFLYMGRYNLNSAIGPAFDKAQFSNIYFWGTLTYGFSFVLNGPLTDFLGGRRTVILAAVGSAAANLAMGLALSHALSTAHGVTSPGGNGPALDKAQSAALVPVFSVLYAANMYFQSFGAVSIVKVNSTWFHLKERGTFGGIFGILISLGLYFAFDWSAFVAKRAPLEWVFFVPASILLVFAVVDFFLVKDSPKLAGLEDFDPGDASSGDDDKTKVPLARVALLMLKNPAIMTIAAVEFCSGYLRNSIMQYYRPFAKETGLSDFVATHWGMVNCMAGILGGIFAGVISDRVFQSRRGPVSAVLYAVMLIGSVVLFVMLKTPAVGWIVTVMILAIIGVHGMLSGTASMDFGGRKSVGVVVGMIDGCVYLGTALEALVLGHVLPKDDAAKSAASWWTWPAAILPVALLGLILATRVWNAKPKARAFSA